MVSFIYMVLQGGSIVQHGKYYQNVYKYSSMLHGLNDINNPSFARRVNTLEIVARV